MSMGHSANRTRGMSAPPVGNDAPCAEPPRVSIVNRQESLTPIDRGCVVKAPPGDLPAQFLCANWRRVSRELLARAWSAGAGPGDGPLTMETGDLLAKEGARDHGYTGQRGYHPLLATAGTATC